MTIGSRHLSEPDVFDGSERESRDASVVGAALEIALVVLDASFELDSGRTLATGKSTILLGTGEWANAVFSSEESGELTSGQGGMREGRVRAAAAGVVVKVAEIGEKWGRLGIMS